MDKFRKSFFKHLKNFHKRIDNELTFLLYHGVTRKKSKGIENYALKHIPEVDFVQQVKYLRKHCHVLSIDEMVWFWTNKKKYPPRSVVISFDDGFKNNYIVAAPILADFKLPAVFYITSGIVSTRLMFWVDMVEDCINFSRKSKISIKLDKEYDFRLAKNEDKIIAVHFIKSFCKKNNVHIKNRIIRDLIKETDVKPSVGHAKNYEKISWEELQEMNSNELFTIGGHSSYHDILSVLGFKNMVKDIELSILLLEYHLNKKIVHYSYPEGLDGHYNAKVVNMLKKISIVCCPSAKMGLNNHKVDLFNLNRVMACYLNTPFPFFEKKL